MVWEGLGTGGAGFQPRITQEVAYRMTWATTDANHNTYEGTPSTRVVVSNSSGHTQRCEFNLYYPSRRYYSYSSIGSIRSLASASSTTDPSDELQLAPSRLS